MKKIIIGASLPESLINFRGELIQHIKDKDCEVITVSPPPSEVYSDIFKKKKIINIPISIVRSKLDSLGDLIYFIKLFKIFPKKTPVVIF